MSNLNTVCWSPPSTDSRTRLRYTWTSWHMGSDPFSTVFQQKTLVSDFEVLSSRQTLVHHLHKAEDEAFKKSVNTMKVNTLCSYTSTRWPVTTARLVPPNSNNFGKMTGDSSPSSETWLKTPSIVSRSSRLYLVCTSITSCSSTSSIQASEVTFHPQKQPALVGVDMSAPCDWTATYAILVVWK